MKNNMTIRSPRIMKETSRGTECFNIEDDFFERREIFLTSQVDVDSTNELLKQLMYLNNKDSKSEITLYINSPGGAVDSGLAVYDCIRMIEAPVRTVCTGTAASMGAIIFLAGDKREMFPHTQIMIHDPHYGGGIEGMKPLELKERFDSLMKDRDVLCQIIAERTGRNFDEVCEKTKFDSFFKATEALNFGLATKIIKQL